MKKQYNSTKKGYTMKITANMLIEDIVEQFPETIRPMQEMGVQCMVCGEPVWGTLEEKVKEKGMDNLEEIVQRLNDVVKNKEHVTEKGI
ncbi:MAG TPA: DUF1858 domain-containing protein [Calditrichaeota bacterium]|nr:DUF1858 domain-containing protein [Calditrichota bacterium]